MIYELHSVGSVIDTETLFTYPMLVNGGYDKNQNVHIDDIDIEWLHSLSDEDFGTINELINKRNLDEQK